MENCLLGFNTMCRSNCLIASNALLTKIIYTVLLRRKM